MILPGSFHCVGTLCRTLYSLSSSKMSTGRKNALKIGLAVQKLSSILIAVTLSRTDPGAPSPCSLLHWQFRKDLAISEPVVMISKSSMAFI